MEEPPIVLLINTVVQKGRFFFRVFIFFTTFHINTMIKIQIELPQGEPYESTRVMEVSCPPRVGDYISDPNGHAYRITHVIHLIDPRQIDDSPNLKVLVEKESNPLG